jgi:hypothetical protein
MGVASYLTFSKPVFDEKGGLTYEIANEIVDTSLLFDTKFAMFNWAPSSGLTLTTVD